MVVVVVVVVVVVERDMEYDGLATNDGAGDKSVGCGSGVCCA